MSKPMLSHIASLLTVGVLALGSLPAAAQEDELVEMRRLQELLTVLNQELKADLDQILVLQQAQRINAAMPDMRGRSPDMVLYTDVEAARRRAVEQDAELQARLSGLLDRSKSLDARKQQILERILEIGGSPAAATPAPAQPATPGY